MNEAQRLLDELERRRKIADDEATANKAATAKRDSETWSLLPEAGESAYLERKQVNAYGIRFGSDHHGKFIAVPLRLVSGKFTGFQRIYDTDGRKHFPKGVEKKGAFHLIGTIDPDGVLVPAEGYATGATIHEATGKPVAVCFDSGNIRVVAESLKEVYPGLTLIIAADNDQWKAEELDGQGNPKGNAGIKAAFSVARAIPGTKVAVPNFENLDTSGQPTDFNDLYLLSGLDSVKRQLDRAKEPSIKPVSAIQGDSSSHGAIQFKCTEKGAPKAIVHNALQVLRNSPVWAGVLAYDKFSEQAMLINRPPYDHTSHEWVPRPFEDYDDISSADWMQATFDLPVSSSMVSEAVQVATRSNCFHPVKNYLSSLKWDGKPRLDAWLIEYFGAADSEYTRAVDSKTLIAGVARIYLPGCKVDTVLILDGPQGFLKSTAWRVLTSDEWFTDHMPDLHSKDAMQQLSGKWIIELAELSALGRSDIELTKRFISAVQDSFRPAYGRRNITLPRQCIFVGTTNETCYLKDSTGNRRFWPVTVNKKCDISRLRADRNQLWAEAVHRFNQGEKWHLTGSLEKQAEAEQQDRITPDEWEAPILQYLNNHPEIMFVTSGEILLNVFSIDKKDWSCGWPQS